MDYSQNYDIAPVLLRDEMPENMIKVYPYQLVDANKSKAFMEDGAVSLAAISQTPLDKSNLLKDDNGAYYFEMYMAITANTVLDISSTSTEGQELKEEQTFQGVANYFVENQNEKLQMGDFKFLPFIFSIGKPFNESEYEQEKLPVFIASSIIEAKPAFSQAGVDIDPQGEFLINFVNITNVESSFKTSRVLFYGKDKDLDLSNGIKISVENTSLLNRITAKGLIGNSTTDVDFTINDNLIPLKSTPVGTDSKLTMFMDWFDYDMAMPEFIARQF